MELVLTQDLATSDRDLAVRVRRGDAEAFGDLVERYKRRAYYAALGLVGSHEDALDLSQEAFARAFRARKTLDPERPFYAWLYQIIRRLCFNFHRDRKTRRRYMEEAGALQQSQFRCRWRHRQSVQRLSLVGDRTGSNIFRLRRRGCSGGAGGLAMDRPSVLKNRQD